jgi:LPXTG-site transpeptidase (sortase) family protein
MAGSARTAIVTLTIAVLLTGCASPVTVQVGSPAPTPAATLASASPESSSTTEDEHGATTEEPASVDTAVTGRVAGSAQISVSDAVDGARLRTAPPVSLQIPDIGIATAVVDVPSMIGEDGWTWALPRHEAAHLLGTANPGEPGNVIISGHVALVEGRGVFEALPSLAAGAEIVVSSADGDFRYRVVSSDVVGEDDVRPLVQTTTETLTLITCLPDGAFAHRVVVRATRV